MGSAKHCLYQINAKQWNTKIYVLTFMSLKNIMDGGHHTDHVYMHKNIGPIQININQQGCTIDQPPYWYRTIYVYIFNVIVIGP